MRYHPVTTQITTLLEETDVPFKTFEHEAVRTSEEAAALRPEYTLSQGTKALIISIKDMTGKRFVMLVVPGDKKFNEKKVKEALGIQSIRFATREETDGLTQGIEFGGVPPFGNLFGLDVYADDNVFDNEEIIFNAGDKRFSVAMASRDYKKIVKPYVLDIV